MDEWTCECGWSGSYDDIADAAVARDDEAGLCPDCGEELFSDE